ncbi:MAG: hypothetical protein ACR2PR_06815 [Pseudohongiellaceae bacterium]
MADKDNTGLAQLIEAQGKMMATAIDGMTKTLNAQNAAMKVLTTTVRLQGEMIKELQQQKRPWFSSVFHRGDKRRETDNLEVGSIVPQTPKNHLRIFGLKR